jgi:hypothetical protein
LSIALFTAALAVPPSAMAAPYLFPGLGTGANFAVFGLTGLSASTYTVTELGATIYGNEGISRYGTIAGSTATHVYGNIYEYGTGTTQVTGSPAVSGVIYPSSSLVGLANTDISGAISSMAGAGRTQSPGSLLGAMTVTGNHLGAGAANVIDFTNITLSNNANLILSGDNTDYFVVRISGSLSLSSGSQIVLAGVASSHVIYDFTGTGTIYTEAGTSIAGIVIAPTMSAGSSIGGTINGGLFVGNHNLTLASSAVVSGIPEPGTFVLIGGALIGVALLFKRARL